MRKQKREGINLGIGARGQIMVWEITCDACGKARLRVRCLGTMEAEAEARDWRVIERRSKGDEDLCPACRRLRGLPTLAQEEERRKAVEAARPRQLELFGGLDRTVPQLASSSASEALETT